jgi:RNA polymerase sigma-70 factor, ECF subfamily
MVPDIMSAEDMVQNVFLKLYENMDKIRVAESVHFWIFRTARNEVYGWYRKNKVYKKVFDPSDTEEMEISSGINLSDEVEIREIASIINEELLNLPEEQREVFLLKEYGGFSYKEIAELMSITGDLVKSRLFKVRKKILDRVSRKVK